MIIFQIIYSLCSGGAERFVVDLSNRLAEGKGNDVALLVVNDLRQKGSSHYLSDLNDNGRVKKDWGSVLSSAYLKPSIRNVQMSCFATAI